MTLSWVEVDKLVQEILKNYFGKNVFIPFLSHIYKPGLGPYWLCFCFVHLAAVKKKNHL